MAFSIWLLYNVSVHRVLLSLFLYLIPATLFAQQDTRPIVGVLNFQASGISKTELEIFLDYLSSSIAATGKYRIIDRTQRETILKEIEFSLSDCTDEKCQLEIGKLLSANQIIVGSLGKVSNRYLLTIKLIDVETAEAIRSVSEKYESMDALIDNSPELVSQLLRDEISSFGAKEDKGTIEHEEKERKNLVEAELYHYQVFAEMGEARSLEITRIMEAALVLYNDLFGLLPSAQGLRFRVRIFRNKAGYDTYLQGLIGVTRPDFVYVSYRDPARNELVGFERPALELNRSLLHYGLIQFLSILQPTTPLWLAEGAAAYLEASTLQDGRFIWQPNYAWLGILKGQLSGGQARLPISELMILDKARAASEINTFYPMAWGFVHFLLQSRDWKYNRLFSDLISSVRTDATLAENSERVAKRAFAWVREEDMQRDFEAFIMGTKAFTDLLKEGTDYFAASRLDEAEKAMNAALTLQPDSFSAYYYLGLISYQRKNYARADELYHRAMELGIEQALIHYALGVNAFAQKKWDEAATYLKKAKELDPQTYGRKADLILKRIKASQ
jgi:tetratricopeptide (TPR) repeat protein